MSDKIRLPIQELLSRGKCERSVYVGKGKYRTISARRAIWEMLDFLVEKSNYPIEELIDDCIAYDGESMLEWSFEENALRAIIAYKAIEDGFANWNFATEPDPVTGRAFVPMTSPVWRIHKQPESEIMRLPAVKGIGKRVSVVQYTGSYSLFKASIRAT